MTAKTTSRVRTVKCPDGCCSYKIPAGAVYDAAKADRVVRFSARYLRHMKGRWAGQPFVLEHWQEWKIVRPLFGIVEKDTGLRWYREALIGLARKNGKALDVDTPILTLERGFVPIGEIRPGDKVFHPSGEPTSVLGVSDVMHDHDCYRVTFSDGRSVVADAGHLWTVRDRSNGRKVTVTTEHMATTLRIGNRPTHQERRYSVDVPASVNTYVSDLPVDPYLLGLWLGDGSSSRAEITTADPEAVVAIQKHFETSYVYSRGKAATYGIKGGLITALKALEVVKNKHVPEQYLIADPDQRLELLRGLMDTDGCVSGKGRQTRVEFTSTNPLLAEAVLYLARSLGWKATQIEGRATLYGKDCGPKYRVSWTADCERSPFRLKRKTTRLGQRPEGSRRSESIQVVSVEQVASRPVRCIQVEACDGMFLAGRDLVPTHNSELAAGLVLYMLMADGEYGAEVYSLAGDKKQASLVYKTASSMVKASPIRSAVKVYRNVMEVGETGSNYWVLSADADLQHGTNPHAAIIDEYHIHKDDEQYVAMRTGTAARTQPLIITITTAGAEKKGPLWDLYQKGLSGTNGRMFLFWHGAPEGADLHDPKVWVAANLASWVTEKFLREQYDALPLSVFARLHLNYWYEGAGEEWIARDKVVACIGKPVIDVDLPVCVAVDAASRRDTTAVMLVQRDRDGSFHRRCWHFTADDSLGYFDYGVLENLIRDLASTYDLRRMAFDPFQMVRSAQMLEAEGIPVEMFPQNDTRMVPATGLLYDLIVERRLVLDDCPVCVEQIANAGVAESARGWRLHKKKSRSPIDSAVALAMAVQLAEWEFGDGSAPTFIVV